MFETSVVHAPIHATRGKLSFFTISVMAHSAVILGAIGVSIASVDFPSLAPDEFARAPIFMPLLQVPPPLGAPDGGAPPRQAAPVNTPPPPQQPNQITAPASTPNDIPQLDAPSTSNGENNAGTNPNGTHSGPVGQPWGDPNSVGPMDGPPVDLPAQPAVEERIYQAHEVKAPVILYRLTPDYPEIMKRARVNASVTVRCIIDKNGHVRDLQVIRASPFAPFNEAVVKAVKQWRFTPGSVGDVAVESYLNLTVNFGLN